MSRGIQWKARSFLFNRCVGFCRVSKGRGSVLIGQLKFTSKGRGTAERGDLYGLPVLLARTDPEGWLGERRLRRAGRGLRRGGVLRTLVPKGFDRWALLEEYGLRGIDPTDLVRGQSVPLALRALERRGVAPDRATVALRGLRADRDMARTAALLCRSVRLLVISAPQGGGALAEWLRREFGVPVLPPGERGALAVRFHPQGGGEEEAALDLYGPSPGLDGILLSAPALKQEDQTDLSLLAALWEGGQLRSEDLKIT